MKLGRFGKNLAGTFVLNVSEAFFSFITAVFLTRIMGAAAFGVYSYVIALVGILSVLIILGQDKLLVKELAKTNIKSQGFRLFRSISSTVFSIYCVIMMFYVVYINYADIETLKYESMLLLPILLLIVIVIKMLEAFMQGNNEVARSLLAMKLVKPISYLAILYTATLWIGSFNASTSVTANILASLVALFFILSYVIQHGLFRIEKAPNKSEFITNLRSGLPFALIASISVINGNIDIIMLAHFVDNEDVGIYRVVHRVTSLTAFALTAVNAVFGPRISAFYAEQNFSEMQRLAVLSAIAVAAIAIPTSAILIFQGNLVLLVFGQEFVQGDITLKIMVIGQLVNVFTGSVGLILAMTSYARKVSTSLALACIANVVINLLLIPVMGINGAALATVASVAMVNLINLYWVITKLKINPTIFGVFKLRSDVKI